MTSKERDAKLDAINHRLQSVELTKIKLVTEAKVAIVMAESVAEMEKARLELAKQEIFVDFSQAELERGFDA